mmetsp:Transcript_19882/g.38524  ORF Transcript_19882/g.38524 Transcript_19882/m.38524 type:complete len:495 (-) Transcript_19882:133-1617(-)
MTHFLCAATFVTTTPVKKKTRFGHRVKSINMSSFTSQEASMLERGGNDVAREIWMGRWKGKLLPTIKDSDGDRLEKIRSHITRKYIDKKWVPDPTTAKRHAFARGGSSVQQLFDVDVGDGPDEPGVAQDSAPSAPAGLGLDLDELFGGTPAVATSGAAGGFVDTKVAAARAAKPEKSRQGSRGPKQPRRNNRDAQVRGSTGGGKGQQDTLDKGLTFLDTMMGLFESLWKQLFLLPKKGKTAISECLSSDKKGVILAHGCLGWLSMGVFFLRASLFSFKTCFSLCVLLEAFHFYVVKNVTGPRILRLRWFFEPVSLPKKNAAGPKPSAAEKGTTLDHTRGSSSKSGADQTSSSSSSSIAKAGEIGQIPEIHGGFGVHRRKSPQKPSRKRKASPWRSLMTGHERWAWKGEPCEGVHPSVRWLFWFILGFHIATWLLLGLYEFCGSARGAGQWAGLAMWAGFLASLNFVSFSRGHAERQDKFIGEIVDVDLGPLAKV